MENSLSTHILALKADKRTSKISRIRHIFNEIEIAKQAGVSHVALVGLLKENGIDVTVKSLSKMLVRIRRDTSQAMQERSRLQRPEPKQPLSLNSPADISPATEELSPKQRGERIADRFISDSTVSPLLKSMKNKYK